MKPAVNQHPFIAHSLSQLEAANRRSVSEAEESVDVIGESEAVAILAEQKEQELAVLREAMTAGKHPSVLVLERMVNEIEGAPYKTAIRIYSLERALKSVLDRLERVETSVNGLLAREVI